MASLSLSALQNIQGHSQARIKTNSQQALPNYSFIHFNVLFMQPADCISNTRAVIARVLRHYAIIINAILMPAALHQLAYEHSPFFFPHYCFILHRCFAAHCKGFEYVSPKLMLAERVVRVMSRHQLSRLLREESNSFTSAWLVILPQLGWVRTAPQIQWWLHNYHYGYFGVKFVIKFI